MIWRKKRPPIIEKLNSLNEELNQFESIKLTIINAVEAKIR